MAEFVEFDVEAFGETETRKAFVADAERFRDLSEPLREVQAMLSADLFLQFATEGAYLDGSRWAPLSPRYAVWKARHFPGRPILVRTGEMRADALTAFTVGPRKLSWHPEKPAVFHQFGTRYMPQRRILAVEDSHRIDQIFTEYVRRVLRG